MNPQGSAPSRLQRKALAVGVYYGRIPWALSIVMGSVLLSHSISISLSLLQTVHCSLHGNCIKLCVSLLFLFSKLAPLLPPLLLLGSPSSLCHSAAAPSSLIYSCIALAPPPLLSHPVAFWEQTCLQWVLAEFAISAEAGGETWACLLLYGCSSRLSSSCYHGVF